MSIIFYILLLPPLAVLANLILSQNTFKIWSTTSTRSSSLTFSPQRLSVSNICLLIGLVVLKALLPVIGLVPKLKPTVQSETTSPNDGLEKRSHRRHSLGSSQQQPTFDLPAICVEARLDIGLEDVQRYEEAATLPLPAGIGSPGTLTHRNISKTEHSSQHAEATLLFAASTTPLMLLLLANRNCPIQPLGAVNVRNRFEFHDATACRNVLTRKLRASGRMGGPSGVGRRVKRGVEFDIVIEVSSCNENKVVFRQIVTILQTLPRRTKPLYVEVKEFPSSAVSSPAKSSRGPPGSTRAHSRMNTPSKVGSASKQQLIAVGELKFASHAPSLWAKVCCDYNPIHVSALIARMFGFGGRIAHGNHVVASVVELCKEKGLGDEIMTGKGGRGWWLEVDFRRPMVLPLKMEVKGAYTDDVDHGTVVRWEVGRAGKIFVEGSIGTLQSGEVEAEDELKARWASLK
jgi:hypothetical protein